MRQDEFGFEGRGAREEALVFPFEDEDSIVIPGGRLTKWERVTALLIQRHPPIHQREIIAYEPWMGCHPKYEVGIGIPIEAQSTMRQARQQVNNLRRKHAPILSGVKGYWPAKSKGELVRWLKMLEQRAQGQARGFLRTYHSMDELMEILHIPRSDYFEAQPWDPDEEEGGNGDPF